MESLVRELRAGAGRLGEARERLLDGTAAVLESARERLGGVEAPGGSSLGARRAAEARRQQEGLRAEHEGRLDAAAASLRGAAAAVREERLLAEAQAAPELGAEDVARVAADLRGRAGALAGPAAEEARLSRLASAAAEAADRRADLEAELSARTARAAERRAVELQRARLLLPAPGAEQE